MKIRNGKLRHCVEDEINELQTRSKRGSLISEGKRNYAIFFEWEFRLIIGGKESTQLAIF